MTSQNLKVEISETVFSQHSFHEGMHACARLFASCDTKWFDLMVPIAVQQLIDDTLLVSLHLRRVSEATGRQIRRTIENRDMGIPRPFDEHETSLWRAINKIIHHQRLDPVVHSQHDFYRKDDGPMAGHLITDIRVSSDEGVALINLSGFAIACSNEFGVQLKAETNERLN